MSNATPTPDQLEAFIRRAGFTHGWDNLESWARTMAEKAVTELNAAAAPDPEPTTHAVVSQALAEFQAVKGNSQGSDYEGMRFAILQDRSRHMLELHRAGMFPTPPEAAPAVPAWQPIGTVDLSALDGPVWMALVGGQVLAGEYEWRQGHYPDGFNTAGCGRFGLHEVTHCMPYSTPQHPAAAPQPQPEAPVGSPADLATWVEAQEARLHAKFVEGMAQPEAEHIPFGSWANLKLMMQRSAFRGVLQLDDAQRNIDDFAAQLETPSTFGRAVMAFKRCAEAAISASESAQPKAPAESGPPSGYEAITPVYTRWVSPSRYAKFSPAVQKWYRPYWAQPEAPAPTAPAVTKEALAQVLRDGLSDTFHCGRVWSAWNVGTMSEDDFSPVDESDTPEELADAVLALLEAPTPQPERAEPIGYLSPEQLPKIVDPHDDSGTYIPMRKTARGLFRLAVYAQPERAAVAPTKQHVDALLMQSGLSQHPGWIMRDRGRENLDTFVALLLNHYGIQPAADADAGEQP